MARQKKDFLPKLNPDSYHVCERTNTVWWRGSYPFVMAIDGLMKKHFPGYVAKICDREYLADVKAGKIIIE